MILAELGDSIRAILTGWAKSRGVDSPPPVVLTPPPKHLKSMDLSLPWPLAAAKVLKRKPPEIAEEARKLLAGTPGIGEMGVHGGFINIKLDPAALGRNLIETVLHPERCGAGGNDSPRDINLEFVSANPTGPVHVASGRAATLGDVLARILRRRGHKVRTEYYVNDAGRQVRLLGLSVKTRYDQARGKKAALPEGGYRGDYILELAAAAPPEASGWSEREFEGFAVDHMLASHQEDMRDFGVSFDRWFRESELHDGKSLDAVLDKLRKLGRVYEKDGAVWLGSASEGSEDDKDRVLVRSSGEPTYFLADIAYHQDKLDRGATELIDIWGADHHGYVPRMKEAVAALGHPKAGLHLIIHQLVRLFRGKEAVKMSKRAGEFVTLRELTAEAGRDACRFFFSMRTPNSHMNFDVELAKKQSNDNPVYYVQYVHARACSIFREARDRGIIDPEAELPDPSAEDLALLSAPEERALLIKLAWFPEALRACERDLSPVPIPTYLTELSSLYHRFYENCRVLDPDVPGRTKARLMLCAGVRAVIADGLGLLGVSTPERM